MLHIEPGHLVIVQMILKKYPYDFYVFGSRAKGGAKKLSDLDLCYFDSISLKELIQLEDDFIESNLPYKVDLVNWHQCSDEFQSLIKQDMILLPK